MDGASFPVLQLNLKPQASADPVGEDAGDEAFTRTDFENMAAFDVEVNTRCQLGLVVAIARAHCEVTFCICLSAGCCVGRVCRHCFCSVAVIAHYVYGSLV